MKPHVIVTLPIGSFIPVAPHVRVRTLTFLSRSLARLESSLFLFCFRGRPAIELSERAAATRATTTIGDVAVPLPQHTSQVDRRKVCRLENPRYARRPSHSRQSLDETDSRGEERARYTHTHDATDGRTDAPPKLKRLRDTTKRRRLRRRSRRAARRAPIVCWSESYTSFLNSSSNRPWMFHVTWECQCSKIETKKLDYQTQLGSGTYTTYMHGVELQDETDG